MPNQGREKLISTIKDLQDVKQDSRIQFSALLGRHSQTGQQEITVTGRTNFVYVRIRGQDSDTWQVFNDKVGIDQLSYGIPVLIEPDPTNLRQYRVIGRDSSKLQNWTDPSTMLPSHGSTHSFYNNTPKDPVWIYRRQLVQPLLCRPANLPGMTVYVEADFYYWSSQFKYFYGGNSPDLTSYIPTDISNAKYVTIYLDGSGAGTVAVVDGTEFSKFYPPADKIPFIPEVDPALGIPLAAIYLTSTTTAIHWEDLYDIRMFLYAPSSGSPQVAVRVNSGAEIGVRRRINFIPGTNITISGLDDPGNNEVQVIINSSGGGVGHEHAMTRQFLSAGTTVINLPDYASQIESVTIGGLEDDPLDWSLNLLGDQITLSNALAAEAIITAKYILEVI